MKMFGQNEAENEQQTARRWWRRLRDEEGAAADPGCEPATGAIVREGERVRLRRHIAANRGAFQRWYADHDIARLLRHELKPLTYVQSLVYFDTSILPSSARGLTCAIHDRETDELIGTTGLTDLTSGSVQSCYFRIVIGESRFWGQGYGTEATRLMMREAFERHGRDVVRLEVFDYNERAIRAYERVGFVKTGEHTEYPSREGDALRVIEMSLRKEQFDPTSDMTRT